MATLYYNGIHIDIIRTMACRRRVVYDSGNSYLWTEWFIHVRGVLNPQATSYDDFEPNPAVPRSGSTPSFTDQVIRHQLSQPRKKLIFTAAGPGAAPGLPPNLAVDGLNGTGGTLVILECPPVNGGRDAAPNFTGSPAGDAFFTDAQMGPVPSVFNVVRIDGLRTIHVEFAVTCFVNECYNYHSSPAVLLSHRWTQTHNVDRDGFTARNVRGHAIFRSDVLLNMNARPDDFRTELLHPIGRNAERQNVRVVAHEDSCRLDYSFTDQEVSHNVTLTHVSRIEAFATIDRHQPSTSDIAGSFWRPFLGGASRFGDVLGAVNGALPGLAVTVVARVWGTRRASRALLRNVAANVIVKKLPAPAAPGSNVPLWTLDSRITYDLVGRYVECRITYLAGPQTTITLGGTMEDESDRVFPDLIKDDINGIALTDDRLGRMAVLGNTSRGTWLQACVAQALQTPCDNPKAPKDSGYRSLDIPAPGTATLTATGADGGGLGAQGP